MFLKQRWRRLWGYPNLEMFRSLEASYSAVGRHYHTPTHLEECFRELDGIPPSQVKRPVAVEFAIWYHDIIYFVDKAGSEEASALYAHKQLTTGEFNNNLVETVARYIRATAKHTEPTDDTDLQHFLDIDLAILGQYTERFDEYERQIRDEYAWVPEEIYRFERGKILKKFLEGPIYKTEHFRRKYEAPARANLARSIELLSQPH